ncbi:MAG TPA: SDR family oxidoreductase [Trinickia sp.]|nr:SDR family oxidoreductase [Trinickia sp.]HVW51976.1 SDR family oxidoreductase [Trinickia sp.]
MSEPREIGRQTAIVTGAAQGLGAVIAQRLHAAGYNVAIADIAFEKAQGMADELDPLGATAMAVRLDVGSKPEFEAARDTVLSKWGALHVAVNNAALTPATPVMDITPEEFDRVIATNLRGTFFGCQVFGAAFAKARYGRIVNLASLAAHNGGTTAGAHYASSKAGIITLTKIFARDLSPLGVSVNAIAPGPLDLPIVHQTVAPDRLAKMIEAIPARQIGDPNFVGDLVVLLASPHAGFATGATFDVNGGIYMR